MKFSDDKLHNHVVTYANLYTGQMLGSVMKMSYGLLSLEPKDKDGNPIENLEDYGNHIGRWQELKASKHKGMPLQYMQSFEKDTDRGWNC